MNGKVVLSSTGYSVAQSEVGEVGEGPWDAIVIGAGPAGSAAALRLAERGLRTLLVERERFPREKTCGDGLTPESLERLKGLGLYDKVLKAGHLVERVRAFSPSGVEVEVSGYCVTLKRSIFDAIMARAAVEKGAAFAFGEVVSVETGHRDVNVVFGGGERICARTAIVATGADWKLPLSLGMVETGLKGQAAVRRYLRSSAVIDELIFSLESTIMPGYAWIFPLGDGLYNLGCGDFRARGRGSLPNLRNAFNAFLEHSPPARELLSRGEFVTPLKGGVLRCALRGVKGSESDRVVAVGEASATTIPFSGEGIGKALESGELAASVVADALAGGDFSKLRSFPREERKRFGVVYDGYEKAQRLAGNRLFVEMLMKKANRNPRLTSTLTDIVEGKVQPDRVFSARGLWRAFLS